MAASSKDNDEDEGSYDHAGVQSVTNYQFVDDKDEPISFCVLPFECNVAVVVDDDDDDDDVSVRRSTSVSISKKKQQQHIFLHGTADASGLQKIYKQATAWKFELSEMEPPQIWVLSKEENIWINLQKPLKSFEDKIRTILITINWLHFFKRNPEETSERSLWDHLWKVFSSCEVKPSENDLIDHLSLIRDAVKNDPTLSKSKFLVTFLENPIKRKTLAEGINIGSNAKRSKFIVDSDEELDVEVGAADEVESDEDADLFDSVCSICDNGGEILCCEGRCLRSFHATKDDGLESHCKSLGLSKAQVKAFKIFLCNNCQYKQHQCFACGMLGSSDKSSGAEVIPCVSATCGYFYHPKCVAKCLYPENGAEAENFQKRIVAGESFTCPAHKCIICKQIEYKEIPELQFAVCRRCPTAYHRKCLPRRIAFDSTDDESITVRAWDGLLPNNRVLIYCLKHRIEGTLGTPVRNHINFPNFEEKKRIDSQSAHAEVLKNRTFLSRGFPCEKNALKKPKQAEKVPFHMKESDSTRKKEKQFSREGFDSVEKSQLNASRKTFNHSINSESVKRFVPMDMDICSTADESKKFMGQEKLKPLLNKGSKLFKVHQQEIPISKFEKNKKSSPLAKNPATLPLDPESKKRIFVLMEEIPFSLTLEELTKSHKVPSTHAYSLKKLVDKTITEGKVEGFVQAVRTALQKLELGCSVEDAKAVCETDILNQIVRWKNKLTVYLAPFLHGMRYTSFGRHFTKVNKLKEIVDKLHWYVKDGDMIVDFCCGANDFSCLMKEKLEETGKSCSFKNYDVIHPKNDFSFEKRDWMTIQPHELATGSNLIMGLNPPFGVKATLANKFIDKALQFKPKLLILIVPQETERVDRKQVAYDLVWEDNEKLRGKSFYLPGSVDINDNQMDQWNIKPPPLYLWSRHDWTPEHKEISLKFGHTSADQQQSHMQEPEEPMALVHKDQRECSLPKYDTNPQNMGQYDEGESHMRHGPCRKRSRENEECQGLQTSVYDENFNIAWRYGLNQKDPVAFGTNSWYVTTTSPVCDYGMHGLEERVPGHIEDNLDNFSATPYPIVLDERYREELGGQDSDSSRRRSHLPIQETGFGMGPTLFSTPPCEFPESSAKPSFNRMTSEMQQYAPQLDELNHAAAADFVMEALVLGSNSMFESQGAPSMLLDPGQKDGANEGPRAGGA